MKTEKQALTAARALWGGRARVRKGLIATSPQIRATAKQAKADLLARRAKGERGLVPAIERHSATACRYQYAVGIDLGYAFQVHGQGDSWDEAFADAAKRAIAT